MIVPASSTAITRRSATEPVSESISTTTTCAPNGNVGCLALKSVSTLSSGSRPAACSRPASSDQSSDGCGAPATWNVPAPSSSTMSRGSASSCSAASSLAFSTSSSAAWRAAAPPIWVDFEPYVPVPRATRSVSPLITVTRSTGSPICPAAICANVVSWPWPCENEPVLTIASPSGVISTAPNSLSPIPLVIST